MPNNPSSPRRSASRAPTIRRRSQPAPSSATSPPDAGPRVLPDSAANQRKTRLAHASERAEDYVEAIAGLIDSQGEARAVDIARTLGVTHVTVIRTVQRLQKLGLVSTRPYRSIFLTDQGRVLARQARERHDLVVSFLECLGIPAAVARSDAEGIEHHVSPATLAAFRKYVNARKGAAGRGDS